MCLPTLAADAILDCMQASATLLGGQPVPLLPNLETAATDCTHCTPAHLITQKLQLPVVHTTRGSP
jgi:hypothetical protein